MKQKFTEYTVDNSEMELVFECPYCSFEGHQNFEEAIPSGFEVVRCENKECDRLFVIEWASMIETRSGKIDFPNARGLLLQEITDEEKN